MLRAPAGRNNLEDALTHPQQASQEEQQAYDLIVGNAIKIMADSHHDQIMDNIRQMGQGRAKPWQAIGRMGHMLTSSIAQKAIAQGAKVNGDVLLNAGAEIIEQLMELAEANNIFSFTEEEYQEHQQMALQEAARLYAQDMKDREFDRGALAKEMSELQEMEARGFDFGSLDQVGPGPVEVQGRMNPIAAGIQRGMG